MNRLRGHHLFCATLFQGCGYNEAFTRSMQEALAALEQGRGCPWFVAATTCAGLVPLPAWERLRFGHGGCAEAGSGCTEACGFSLSQGLSPVQVGERLRQVNRSQWEKVCGGCRWQREGLCSWELFDRLRKNALCKLWKKVAFEKTEVGLLLFLFFLLLSATKYTTIRLNKALNLLKICALCQMLFLGFTGIFRELFVGGKVHKFNR